MPLGMLQNGFAVFLLVLVRMTGLFVTAPIFGRQNIPAYFKVGFSFFTALIMVNTVTIQNKVQFASVLDFTLLVMKEFLTGVTIGYVAYLVFTAIYMAGQLIDMQVGFGMVSVMDPISNIQVPVTSNFYFIVSMLIFLSMNGHHMLIEALYNSFKVIPLGGTVFGPHLMQDIIRVFGRIFEIGFKIAAPIIAAILITDVALGVISRTIPQVNVFVIGMPLKIIIGVAVIIVVMPAFVSVVTWLLGIMNQEVFTFVTHMGGK